MSIFGDEYSEVWPNSNTNNFKATDFGLNLLKKCENIRKPNPANNKINDFVNKSLNFPIQFSTNTCRVQSQPVDRYEIIQNKISTAYPIIHERVLGLYLDFLEHKFKYGNITEQPIYKDLSLTDFVQRLLTKRCVTFTDEDDNYLLLTRERGAGGFEDIGTLKEDPPHLLENLLSYDEMKLSAFLSVSSEMEFINDGRRENYSRIEQDKSKIQRDGINIGLIGGRFQRENVMEWQDIIISKTQNTQLNGYGERDGNATRQFDYRRMWNNFYETKDVLHEKALMMSRNPRFYYFKPNHPDQLIFDNMMMKRRYAISIDTLLLEAEARAKNCGKQAYVHVVGIGLGVWMILQQQENIFLETFAERIKLLLPQLKHISVLNFAWFRFEYAGLKNNVVFTDETHPDGGIRIFFSRRCPSEKLPSKYEHCLLVVSYAWDSNSMPGNEFWENCLGNSNDSSNASSTLVTELHNPYINTEFVNGNNLHVATLNNGVMHIQDYCKNILKLF